MSLETVILLGRLVNVGVTSSTSDTVTLNVTVYVARGKSLSINLLMQQDIIDDRLTSYRGEEIEFYVCSRFRKFKLHAKD